MSPLERLAETLTELAETGNDADLEGALGLCLGFSDMVMHELNIDPDLRERERTEQDPIRRLN